MNQIINRRHEVSFEPETETSDLTAPYAREILETVCDHFDGRSGCSESKKSVTYVEVEFPQNGDKTRARVALANSCHRSAVKSDNRFLIAAPARLIQLGDDHLRPRTALIVLEPMTRGLPYYQRLPDLLITHVTHHPEGGVMGPGTWRSTQYADEKSISSDHQCDEQSGAANVWPPGELSYVYASALKDCLNNAELHKELRTRALQSFEVCTILSGLGYDPWQEPRWDRLMEEKVKELELGWQQPNSGIAESTTS